MNFDVKAYFEDRKIDFHVEGEKNVSRGWVNINCPFPACGDPSWHCGVNLESNMFNCFICGRKGHVINLIQRTESCSYKFAKSIFNSFRTDNLYTSRMVSPPRFQPSKSKLVVLPKGATTDFPLLHKRYLRKRKFDPDKLIKKYKLQAIYNVGDQRYLYRIIIPIFYDSKLVSFTSLDVTDLHELHYRHQPKRDAAIPPKQTLYNIDTVKLGGIVAIVEGVTDVWRIGDGSVGTFGEIITKEQIEILIEKEITEAIVLLDSDAIKLARKYSKYLSGFIDKVSIYEIEDGDPDELNEEDLLKIRMLING